MIKVGKLQRAKRLQINFRGIKENAIHQKKEVEPYKKMMLIN